MKRHVRKWMIAGLVVLAAAPALAGCVAEVGPRLLSRLLLAPLSRLALVDRP